MAALVLAWSGFSFVVYAPVLPLPDALEWRVGVPFMGHAGMAIVVLGVLGVIAGLAVWRGIDSGRGLALLFMTLTLAFEVWMLVGSLGLSPEGPAELVARAPRMVLPVLETVLVAFALVRRWVPGAPRR